METKISAAGFTVTFTENGHGRAVIIHKARTMTLALKDFLEVLDALRSETLRRITSPAERH